MQCNVLKKQKVLTLHFIQHLDISDKQVEEHQSSHNFTTSEIYPLESSFSVFFFFWGGGSFFLDHGEETSLHQSLSGGVTCLSGVLVRCSHIGQTQHMQSAAVHSTERAVGGCGITLCFEFPCVEHTVQGSEPGPS